MQKFLPLVVALVLASSMAEAGFLNSPMGYNGGFALPHSYASEQQCNNAYGPPLEAPYATPAPVAPVTDRHLYAAFGYTAPSLVKFRSRSGGFGLFPFTSYASGRSHHKFNFPPAVASVYNVPAAMNFGSPAVNYNGFETTYTVVKFGPPITTTTTTYSTTASAHLPVSPSFKGVAGW